MREYRIIIFIMDDDDYFGHYSDHHNQFCPHDSFYDMNLFGSSTQNSQISLKVKKPKNYKQSRLNQKHNMEQLQSRIHKIQEEIANEKVKKQYCSRCGKRLQSSECEFKECRRDNDTDEMDFQPFKLEVNVPKLKGQIWIAIGIIMIVIGHLLYGFGGKEIMHSVSQKEHQNIFQQINTCPQSQTVDIEIMLSNYKQYNEPEVQKVEVYTESIVAMIQNSKDYATLTQYSPFSNWW